MEIPSLLRDQRKDAKTGMVPDLLCVSAQEVVLSKQNANNGTFVSAKCVFIVIILCSFWLGKEEVGSTGELLPQDMFHILRASV